MTFSRRKFATMVGAGAVGATFGARFLRSAKAQSTGAPVRFLAVRTPHGADRDFWIPKLNGNDPPSADMALGELSFSYTNSALDPLAPWADKITVIDGLDQRICREATRSDRRSLAGHNEQGSMLTGAQPPADREGNYDGHPSLDFYLHSRLASPALLTASVEGAGLGWKCMSYDGNGQPRMPEANPRTLFRQAFPEGYMPTDTEMPEIDYTEGERLIGLQDQTLLTSFRDRLSGREREKLDSHLAAMARFIPEPGGGGIVGACTTRGTDLPTTIGLISAYTDVETVTRAQASTIAQAFACGRSRSATLQILNDFPNWYTDLPEVRTPAIVGRYGSTNFRFHESLVHDYWTYNRDADLRVGYSAGLRWSSKLFTMVLDELDSIVDPADPSGGTILDNTIVFWHNEFGHGGHDGQHTMHPVVIAGGGGRTLKLGRYLRLRDVRNSAQEALIPHNKLLTSICQAMGLNDVNYFGDRDLATHPAYQGPLLPLMV